MTENYEFDLIVIGGGSGGLRAAKEAGDLGAKVALLDYVKPSTQGSKWNIGGTCVNVGCIPKKQMHYAAKTSQHLFQQAYMYGWNVFPEVQINEEQNPTHHISDPQEKQKRFDWQRLVAGVTSTRAGSSYAYRMELKSKNVKYFQNLGSLVDAHTVLLTDPKKPAFQQTITGKHIVLAVGGRPHIPDEVEGASKYAVTSDDIFTLDKAPGKTLVVGASYIALETAGFMAAFGFDTTVMVRSAVLRSETFDREIVGLIEENMQSKHHVKFLRPFSPVKIEQLEDGKKKVTFINNETKETSSDVFDTVLFATGRGADTKALGLDKVGVEYTKEGKIKVNQEEQTNVPSIYAIGDIVENGFNFELTPVAIQQGKLLAWRLFSTNAPNPTYAAERRAVPSKLVDYHFIPTTVFTPQEYGLVGHSEESAKKKYGAENLVIYKKKINILEYKIPNIEEKGFVKLICLKENNGTQERVIGLHYLGPEAAEVVQGYALGLKKGATKEDFDDLIGIHPSNAESFVYLQEGVFEDKSCCG